MTDETRRPKPTGSNPLLMLLIGQAAVKAGTEHNDSRMTAAGERALQFAAKMVREGKSGTLTDGESVAIVEK